MNILKDLKAQYKAATGQDYVAGSSNNAKPVSKKEMAPVAATAAVPPEAEGVVKNITEQGNKIRDLKASKAAKVSIRERSLISNDIHFHLRVFHRTN